MSTESRHRLAGLQAELVRALVAHGPVPAGFDLSRVHAVTRALVQKRRQAILRVRPSLAVAVGASFHTHFLDYANAHPLPEDGTTLADAWEFLAWLDRHAFSNDACRLEMLAFRLRYVRTARGIRGRRGPALKLTRLRDVPALAIAVRLPILGERWFRVPVGFLGSHFRASR